jgi:hypothetical protein
LVRRNVSGTTSTENPLSSRAVTVKQVPLMLMLSLTLKSSITVEAPIDNRPVDVL